MSNGRTIKFKCECGQIIEVPVERAGAKGRCKLCGRELVVPPPQSASPPVSSSRSYRAASPRGRGPSEETYSQEDLITYPEYGVIQEEPLRSADDLMVEEQRVSFLGMYRDILKYPVSNKTATQIFLTGAILFSPLAWLLMRPLRYLGCIGVVFAGFVFLAVISFRLMYFSYMLLIIEKSSMGIRQIPELPLFQSWQDNVKDLLKVLGASVIAFSPFITYAIATNIEIITRMWEAQARGEIPGANVFGEVAGNLQAMIIMYAIAAFYMPMVLMSLVVTRSFLKAINPAFIIRSILRMRKEYLSAMIIIFLFLRGSLTLFTILKDVLATDWFARMIGYVAEPILEFYVLVVTMHVIGLLYYRNGHKLQW
ncbi:MAG: hypothetical protein Kow0099_15610 [Candidatus Abyssubacteria bacterium]